MLESLIRRKPEGMPWRKLAGRNEGGMTEVSVKGPAKNKDKRKTTETESAKSCIN